MLWRKWPRYDTLILSQRVKSLFYRLVTEQERGDHLHLSWRRRRPRDVLSLDENAEALVHRGLVLSSVGLTLPQRLHVAKRPRQSLEQSFSHMQGLEHLPVDCPQVLVDLNLVKEAKVGSHLQDLIRRTSGQIVGGDQ